MICQCWIDCFYFKIYVVFWKGKNIFEMCFIMLYLMFYGLLIFIPCVFFFYFRCRKRKRGNEKIPSYSPNAHNDGSCSWKSGTQAGSPHGWQECSDLSHHHYCPGSSLAGTGGTSRTQTQAIRSNLVSWLLGEILAPIHLVFPWT